MLPEQDPKLTPARCAVYRRALLRCQEYCDGLLALMTQDPDHRIPMAAEAFSDAVVISYGVPFFRNDDADGARFRLPTDFTYFREPALQEAHERLLDLRRAVAHSDAAVTEESFIPGGAPALDTYAYTIKLIAPESVRVARYLAGRLEHELHGFGWIRRNLMGPVNERPGGSSTKIAVDLVRLIDEEGARKLREQLPFDTALMDAVEPA